MSVSHFGDPIEDGGGSGLMGFGRGWGQTTPEVKSQVKQMIVDQAAIYGLSNQDIANLVAIAKLNEGYETESFVFGDSRNEPL